MFSILNWRNAGILALLVALAGGVWYGYDWAMGGDELSITDAEATAALEDEADEPEAATTDAGTPSASGEPAVSSPIEPSSSPSPTAPETSGSGSGEPAPETTAASKTAVAAATPQHCSGRTNSFNDGVEVIVRAPTDRVAAGNVMLALRAPKLGCVNNRVAFADGDLVTYEELMTDAIEPALKAGKKGVKLDLGGDQILVTNLSDNFSTSGRAHNAP
jgi:hypothetical protein